MASVTSPSDYYIPRQGLQKFNGQSPLALTLIFVFALLAAAFVPLAVHLCVRHPTDPSDDLEAVGVPPTEQTQAHVRLSTSTDSSAGGPCRSDCLCKSVLHHHSPTVLRAWADAPKSTFKVEWYTDPGPDSDSDSEPDSDADADEEPKPKSISNSEPRPDSDSDSDSDTDTECEIRRSSLLSRSLTREVCPSQLGYTPLPNYTRSTNYAPSPPMTYSSRLSASSPASSLSSLSSAASSPSLNPHPLPKRTITPQPAAPHAYHMLRAQTLVSPPLDETALEVFLSRVRSEVQENPGAGIELPMLPPSGHESSV